jgi:hypothetical protein
MKKVILVSGKMRSGKNQFSKYLEQMFMLDNKTVVQDCFANTLKDNSKSDFKPLIDYLNNLYNKITNCIPDDDQDTEIMYHLSKLKTLPENFYEDKTDITRILLQLYGTDIFRKRVDMDYWVKLMINKIKESDIETFIITDVRFPNEIYMLQDEKDFDVTTIRIERVMKIYDIKNYHESEIALDDFDKFQYVVDNNDSLEQLWNATDTIYKDIN